VASHFKRYKTTMENDFNKYANNYQKLMDDHLKITGFDTSYYSISKIRKLKDLNPTIYLDPIRILDFGCGIGNYSIGFKEVFPNASYVGVDVASEMIKEARKEYSEHGEFFESRSSDWKNKSYDIIFSAGAFHHIPHEEHEKILKELASLLTASGRIFIWEHNPFNPITQKLVRDCVLDEDAILVNPRKIKNLFHRVQLNSVQIIYTAFFPKFLSLLIPLESCLEGIPLGAQYIVIGAHSK
jgi:trans-aconitate methyltransferase